MRYGLLTDVHGNLEALQSVLEHLGALNLDRYIFLGDAVGYGANPNEVCDLLRPLVHTAVLGNHDAAVCGRMDYDEYYDAARQALDWCVEQLSPENLAWLRGLPHKVRDGDLEYSHGSPLDPEVFDYLFGPDQVVELLDSGLDIAPVTFVGHSHVAISFCVEGDTVTPMFVPEIQCSPDAHYIITVGSVGQPRDRDPRACCGVFDTETRRFEYHRLEYDVRAARQKILDAGLASLFGERLLVGV